MPALKHTVTLGYEGARARHRAVLSFGDRIRHRALWDMTERAKARNTASWDLTNRGTVRNRTIWDLPEHDTFRVRHRARWSILAANVMTITQAPFLEWQGRRLKFSQASLSQDEGGAFWTLRAAILEAADYLAIGLLDPIAIDIFGDRYELVIESKSRARGGSGEQQSFTITARSPLWSRLSDQGETVTKTWPAVSARAAVEELAGETVDWRIVDWTIATGRLAEVNQTPISIIQKIAATAGGVVESSKSGGLIVRYLYPVTIPDVPTVEPDHEISEGAEIHQLSETIEDRTAFDKVFLSDESRDSGYLEAERDPTQPSDIFGGEMQKFRVFHSEDVEVDEILLSTGTVLELGAEDVEVDEEVVFSNTNSAQVSRPVASDFSWVWYGAGLGTITVGADGRKLTAAQTGVGVAKVSYKTSTRKYAVLSPETAGGAALFPIVVYVIGALVDDDLTPAGQRRIIVQRNGGTLQGEDIIEPLASTENVLYVRGRNAIDAASAKGRADLTVAYPADASGQQHYLNGQLALVADTQIGSVWRGKIVNVEHRLERGGDGSITVQTQLSMERFL